RRGGDAVEGVAWPGSSRVFGRVCRGIPTVVPYQRRSADFGAQEIIPRALALEIQLGDLDAMPAWPIKQMPDAPAAGDREEVELALAGLLAQVHEHRLRLSAGQPFRFGHGEVVQRGERSTLLRFYRRHHCAAHPLRS